jgi:hypothetical protein
LLVAALLLALGEILVRRLRLGFPRVPRRLPAAVIPEPTTVPDQPQAPPVAAATPIATSAPPPAEGLHEALRHLRKRR